MKITIKFVNDTRIVQVNKNMFNKLSVIYVHSEIFPNINEIELDMKYDDFLIIHEMLNNKIDQWDLPMHIYDIAHKMGFIDDEIDKMNNLFNAKKSKKLLEMRKFLNTENSLFIPDNVDEYLDYKEAFSNKINIIPVQIIVMSYDDYYPCRKQQFDIMPEFISIYNGIPIYDNGDAKVCSSLNDYGIVTNHIVDINQLRKTMLFTGYDEDALGGYGHVDRLKLSAERIYSNDEIIFLRELLVLRSIHMSDQYIKYLENETFWQNPPPKIFNKMVNNETCDRICNLIKKNYTTIHNHRPITRNKKHVELVASYASHKGGDRDHHYIVGYCCFINISI